ncbi:MAG: hypothetical protein EBZ48_17175, partial [Proteobacteria bacterium]|nr:hypothetical protein [Pseudomonadota bacterium]
MKNYLFLNALCILVLVGCAAQKPEGPAEKIGKGLDQILEGAQQMNDTYSSQDGTQGPGQDTQRRKSNPTKDSRHDLHSDDWWQEREQ